MNHTSIYDKTEKGREEIATRKYQLPSRMRSLLVLIDGKHPLGNILVKVAGLGLNEQHVRELSEANFIVSIHAKPETVEPSLQSATDTENHPDDLLSEQFIALQQFYTNAIREHIGLRGYSLQFRVERAKTIQDFADLKKPFLEAVLKTAEAKIVRSLRDQLNLLLKEHGKRSSPDSDMLNLDK